MALTEEQIQHFYREGYVVVAGLVPSADVKAVLQAAPAQTGAGGGWTAQIFDHSRPETEAAIHRLLAEPNIVDAVRSIFANEPRVYYGMLAIVPAHGGTGLPWHQDNQYTQLLGGALNAFIALSDIASNQGILWVAPRSHRLGTQPSKITEQANTQGHREAVIEPENGMPLPPMRAGDVCLFDRNTYHRSLRNDTDQHRFAYAAQYQAENTRIADTGQLPSAGSAPRLRAGELRALWLREGLLDALGVDNPPVL